jgi:anaerobic selenocysteine-containing dehydrogenase
MAGNIPSAGVTRRQFIKTTAAAAAVVAVGDKLFGGPVSTLVENAAAAPATTEDVWIKTACGGCDRACGIQVRRVNGVVVKAEGNPDDPDNQGKNCGRSNGAPMVLYNPYRVKSPVKRTNPKKGPDEDPKWQEISWDEALDTIAAKLRPIKDSDPRKLVVMGGHHAYDMTFSKSWGRVFGTPTYNTSGFGGQICSGCELHSNSGLVNGSFLAFGDPHFTNLVISFGGGEALLNKSAPGDVREWLEAKERGAKVIAVDPMQTPSMRTVLSEWIPIKPTTDLAFMTAMIYVMLHELKRFDEDFVRRRTNGTYLIGPDGLYVRTQDQLKDPARLNQNFGKPLVWDLADSSAKPWDDPGLKQPAVEGTFDVNGVKARPGFQVIKDHVASFTPEWAEKITTVPAATIRRVTQEFVEAAKIGSTIVVEGVTLPYRPASIESGRGPGVTPYAMALGIARQSLNMLVGNINAPGGHMGKEPTMTPDPVDGVLQPGVGYQTLKYRSIANPPQRADIYDAFPIAYKTHYFLFPAVVNPKDYGLEYQVEALAIQGCNPLGGTGNETVRAALSKIPFIFTISYNFAEPEEYADVILPDNSFLERLAQNTNLNYVGSAWAASGELVNVRRLRQPVVVKPVFNTRDGNQIILDLCDRLGILLGPRGMNNEINAGIATTGPAAKTPELYKLDVNRKYTWAEILDRQVRSTFDDQHGVDWFKQNGIYVTKADVKAVYGWPKWPTTRLPLYYEYIAWAGKQLGEEFKKANVTRVGPFTDVQKILDDYKPLPVYRDDPDGDAPAEFDQWVCHYKTMVHSMAMPMDNAWTHGVEEWNPYDMFVWINAATAAKKGLKDGDQVWVESRYGKTKGEIKSSQAIHPEAVGIGGFFGLHSANTADWIHDGPNWNSLLPLDAGNGKFTGPVLGGMTMHAKVKVYKA